MSTTTVIAIALGAFIGSVIGNYLSSKLESYWYWKEIKREEEIVEETEHWINVIDEVLEEKMEGIDEYVEDKVNDYLEKLKK